MKINLIDRIFETVFLYRNQLLFLLISLIWFIPVGYAIYYKHLYKNIKYEYELLINAEVKSDTVEIISFKDTFIIRPSICQEREIRRDTVRINSYIQDTVQLTLTVELPIVQRTYKQDSLYQVWVSGYKPELDSIKIFEKIQTKEIINNKILYKQKKFGIGPSVGFSYDFMNKRFIPTVGVSINYNLISF